SSRRACGGVFLPTTACRVVNARSARARRCDEREPPGPTREVTRRGQAGGGRGSGPGFGPIDAHLVVLGGGVLGLRRGRVVSTRAAIGGQSEVDGLEHLVGRDVRPVRFALEQRAGG